MTNEENNEVYHNLTESVEAKNPAGKDVIFCLFFHINYVIFFY